MVTLLGKPDTAELFVRTIKSMPPIFIAVNVKRLCLSFSVRGDSSCTGVVDLIFWLDYLPYLQAFPEHSLSSLFSPLPLRRLAIELSNYRTLFCEPAAWFETLTHLDIIWL